MDRLTIHTLSEHMDIWVQTPLVSEDFSKELGGTGRTLTHRWALGPLCASAPIKNMITRSQYALNSLPVGWGL